MKEFFKKLWAKIKKPVCYAAIILLAGLFLFCVIDSIIRCCHQQVFYGIVQVLMCAAALPTAIFGCGRLVDKAKTK